MGADKAEIVLDGARLIDRAVRALEPLAERVLLASGERERFGELGRECVLDERGGAGPLAGLAAGLAASRTRWIALLACDMPFASSELLGALLERARRQGLDGAVFESSSGPEPLCAIYSVACLGAVRDALERGERRMSSFWSGRDGLRALRVERFGAGELGLDASADRQALNLNTPEELAQARASTPGAPPTHHELRSA